jgi:hypothetical protein
MPSSVAFQPLVIVNVDDDGHVYRVDIEWSDSHMGLIDDATGDIDHTSDTHPDKVAQAWLDSEPRRAAIQAAANR